MYVRMYWVPKTFCELGEKICNWLIKVEGKYGAELHAQASKDVEPAENVLQ